MERLTYYLVDDLSMEIVDSKNQEEIPTVEEWIEELEIDFSLAQDLSILTHSEFCDEIINQYLFETGERREEDF